MSQLPIRHGGQSMAASARDPRPPLLPSPPGEGPLAALWMWRTLMGRWWLVGGVALLATGLAAAMVNGLPARYTARADILIERDQAAFADLQRDSPLAGIDPAEMETHLRVLGSERLALRLIDQLGLEPTPAQPSLWSLALGQVGPLADPALALAHQDRMLEEFRDRLAIRRDALAHVITVAYTAADPGTAAAVANGLAEAFLGELVDARRATLAQSARYLSERVEILAQDLERSERAAKDHANTSALYQVQGAPAAELRYGELMRELAAAEVARIRARARSAEVGRGGRIAEELASPTIAELRKQEAEVARRVADQASKLGAKHPVMLDAHAELADIRQSLGVARATIARQVDTELEVAETQARELRQRLEQTERELARNAGALVQLKELRTRAETTRAMYTDMLDRHQRATEQQHLLRPPARVIGAARAPTRADGRHAVLVLGFTALGSLAGGLGLAMLLELVRRGFTTAEQLESETGLPVLGTLPLMRRGRMGWRDRRRASMAAAVFSEAVQRAAARIVAPMTGDAGGCRVVAITSALADEGKSTVSLSIGRQLASCGRRVLLIHADMHKKLAPAFRAECSAPEHDLVELLAQPTEIAIDSAVLRDQRTGLHVLAAAKVDPAAARLLASPALSNLVDRLRASYDVLLIDTPPVLAVSDYLVVTGTAEHLLFVVRWQATPRRAVRAALREIVATGLPLCGLVLNRVELEAYRRRAPEDALGYYRETERYYPQRPTPSAPT